MSGRALRRRYGLVALTAAFALAVGGSGAEAPRAAGAACGLPTGTPLWIDYGEGSVPAPIREIFARPGVVVATSGTELPRRYREKGARTVFFVLNLPRLIGEPGDAASPEQVQAMAAQTYERAVASTECATPIIALNELLAPAAPVPWNANIRAYRTNVLELLRALATRGARPVLFIHGDPGFTGEAAPWWEQVGAVADVAYEAYYKAPVIMRLGRIVGTRRMRLGMRNVADRFLAVGIPRERIGFVLGFQVAPGAAGREGLQPSSEWFRFVKWNALAARQFVQEIGASTIWSWGWATFGPQSVDPDKPAAACVYLWSRDPALCDGPAVAGPGFDASRVEGTITLPPDVICTAASGRIRESAVSGLAALTKSRDVALSGLFARLALRSRVRVTAAEVLAYERAIVREEFGGSVAAYREALFGRGVGVAAAREVIADLLRSRRIADLTSGGAIGATDPVTALAWKTATVDAEADTATCRADQLPGSGDFPASNGRDIPEAPLLLRLPFLGADGGAPAAPTRLRVSRTGPVTLDWDDGAEADLIGYVVFRKTEPAGRFVRLTPLWLTRSQFVDRTAPTGSQTIYVVRAVDLSGNVGEPTPETAATAASSASSSLR